MGIPFLKAAVIYFFIGIVLGIYIGLADQFQFSSAHAHINLLGWVSLAIIGIIYHLFPKAGEKKLAFLMIGIPLLTIAMMLFGFGKAAIAGPVSGIGSIFIFIGVVLFLINVFKNVNAKAVSK